MRTRDQRAAPRPCPHPNRGGGVSAAAEPGLKAPQASTRLWAVAVYTSIPSGDAAFGGKIRIGHIPYLARRYKRTKQGSVG